MKPLAAILLAALLSVAPVAPASSETQADHRQARVTWYLPTGNAMYSGYQPFTGAAACSWDLPLWTLVIFEADGRIVVCLDRGHLGNGTWIDIYAPDRVAGQRIADTYGNRTGVQIITP